MDLGYDGTGFAGWARQPGQRTVQETVEETLATILRCDPPARLTVAGRTDAGVHARGQVAHVDVPQEAWEETGGIPVRRINAVLPGEIVVHAIGPAPPGFDARFSAIARRYAYRVSDRPAGVDPLRRHDVLWHPRPLDLARLNNAARHLLGEHDFAAFCRRREGATTVRRLLRLSWAREEGGLAVATVEADAFCHSMVRSLVGALLPVGDGRRPPEWAAELLGRGERHPAAVVAAAHGLTLEEVRYPPDDLLAVRAAESRSRRSIGGPLSR